MTAFVAIVIVGIGTYTSRSIFILALADREIPPRVARALEYVGPAVLGSLVIALMIDSEGGVAVGVPEAAALVASAVTAWRTRNLIYTLLAGMAAFWVLAVWF